MTVRRTTVFSIVLLALMMLIPAASASRASVEREVRGAMSGQLTFDIDFSREVCPVITRTEAVGTIRHLGLTTSVWTHCPPVLPGQTAYTNGHVTFTAANGDTIVGEYSDADGAPPFVIDVEGGTGRFAGVEGTIVLVTFDAIGEWGDDGLPIQPWHWNGVLEGDISY